MTTLHVVRRAAAATTVAMLTLGGLTACNGNDDEPTATDEPSSSSPSAASSSPSSGSTIDPETFVDDVLSGMSDPTTAHLTMSMEGGSAQVSMDGDVDYTATPPEMAMTMSGAMTGLGDGKDIEVRLVDGVMYLKMPFGQTDKWVKFEVGKKGGPLSEDLLDQMDPGAQLESMKDAITKVEDVGEDETGHHYRLTVRSEAFRKLQDQLGGTKLGGTGADLPEVLTYDVWTDDDNRLTQSVIALGDLGTVTMTLSDWDEDVDIEAPPSSDVMEMPDNMMPGLTS